jgi:UDPglucose 6-dehydrogenase
MNITMVGTGYVGLVTGTCLASLGNNVICVDTDKSKIDMLNKGKMPIFEPGLRDMVELNVKEGRLSFTTSPKEGVEKGDVIFIAVGTPSDEDGHADMRYVHAVAKDIGEYMNGYKVVVDKSTVPVGTADAVKKIIKENQTEKHEFDLVSNPEFLREGVAIKDFMNPDRVVIGCNSAKAEEIMKKIYRGIERTGKPVMFTDIESAEIIKYASNAMLATRISFMNMLAPLCEKMGADIKAVAKGMGLDTRIGPRFLQAGVGYGGSCFPKDVKAILNTLEENGFDAGLLKEVESINDNQKRSVIPKIKTLIPDLKGKKIAIWGLAFKPKTDDMREAPSIVIIDELTKLGAKIRAFDPVAAENAKTIFDKMGIKDIEYAKNPYETLKGCDGLVVVTEWDEFRQLDLKEIKKSLKSPIIIDGRNIYDPKEMADAGFSYVCVGR